MSDSPKLEDEKQGNDDLVSIKIEIPAQSQQEQAKISNEQKITDDTVQINIENAKTDTIFRINIEEDTPTHTQPDNKDLQDNRDTNIAEDAPTKNKNRNHKSVKVTEEQVGEWVFMYQQPQPYPQYPAPQYPAPQYSPPPPQYSPPLPQYQPPQYQPPSSGGGGRQPQEGFSLSQRAEPTGEPLDYYSGNRNDFVQKVFFICAVMLLFTVCFTTIAYITPGIRKFLRTVIGIVFLILAFIGVFTVQYVYCCSDCSRVIPINYILNVIVTFCFTYICSFMSARVGPFIVISAAATTLAVTLLCLGLAYTSFDFTKLLLIVIVAMFALMFASIMVMVLTIALGVKLTIARIIILVIGSVLTSVMLIIEFQMILGGRSVEIGEEDYTFAAFLIYTSIINLFLKMLGLMNLASGD